MVYFPRSFWSTSFLITVVASSAIVLAFEAFVFAKFEANISKGASSTPESRTIPTYLALFIFAEVFQVVLTYDALRDENVIQIVGLCMFSVAMLIYAGIQIEQVHNAILSLYYGTKNLNSLDFWPIVRAFLIAIPCVIGASLLIMSFMTYKLYEDFGWSMYKSKIGADLQLKRRYLCYLIFLTLLKFDFFFFLGFTVQFVVIILETKDVEFALTIAVIPLTIIFLYLTQLFVKKENMIGMILMIVVFFAGMAYFLFKLVRIYQPSRAAKYFPARKSLTIFAVVTLFLLVASIIMAIVCASNFGHGLKPIINSKRKNSATGEEEKYPMTMMNPYIPEPVGKRMIID